MDVAAEARQWWSDGVGARAAARRPLERAHARRGAAAARDRMAITSMAYDQIRTVHSGAFHVSYFCKVCSLGLVLVLSGRGRSGISGSSRDVSAER